MSDFHELGKKGEEQARSYLIDNGYNILHSNWRFHHYELDLVAIHNDMLVVVEVKTRSSDFLVTPEEAVTKQKIRRITAAADAYMRHFAIDLPVRFDIITVVKEKGGYRIEHIDDAFLPPCW